MSGVARREREDRMGTYHCPPGARERDDEGGGAAGLVATVAETESVVVCGDEEAGDEYPANIE